MNTFAVMAENKNGGISSKIKRLGVFPDLSTPTKQKEPFGEKNWWMFFGLDI